MTIFALLLCIALLALFANANEVGFNEEALNCANNAEDSLVQVQGHLRGLVEGKHKDCLGIDSERMCNKAMGCKWMMGKCKPNCGVFLREGVCNSSDQCYWFKSKKECIPKPQCDLFLREGPCVNAGCDWRSMLRRCV